MSLNGIGWRKGAANVLAAIGDVDALASALQNGTITPAQFARIAAAVLGSRAIATTLPLTGGGDFTADRTFAINAADASNPGSLAAADFAKLATVPAGGSIRATFLSDVIDMVTPADYAFTGWPALAGLKLADLTVRWIFTNVAATAFATGPTWQMGNDGTFSNMIASNATTPTAANLTAANGAGAGGPYGNPASFSILPAIKLPDLTTPPKIRITTGATGTAITQAKARVMVTGLYSSAFPTI